MGELGISDLVNSSGMANRAQNSMQFCHGANLAIQSKVPTPRQIMYGQEQQALVFKQYLQDQCCGMGTMRLVARHPGCPCPADLAESSTALQQCVEGLELKRPAAGNSVAVVNYDFDPEADNDPWCMVREPRVPGSVLEAMQGSDVEVFNFTVIRWRECKVLRWWSTRAVPENGHTFILYVRDADTNKTDDLSICPLYENALWFYWKSRSPTTPPCDPSPESRNETKIEMGGVSFSTKELQGGGEEPAKIEIGKDGVMKMHDHSVCIDMEGSPCMCHFLARSNYFSWVVKLEADST